MSLEQRVLPKATAPEGYRVTEAGPELIYDASPLGLVGFAGHKVSIACSKSVNPGRGHTCRVSYPYDASIDVAYEFDDSHFPSSDWLALDQRLRRLVESLVT